MASTPDPAAFEKLGVFYLGRTWDPGRGEVTAEPLLYDSKDLTTHAVCVGMTGSGKTGLCIGLIEEAAIDGIPAIVIDPKGDLGNLALTFPNLAPDDFRPWVDVAEAARAGLNVDQYAAATARRWTEGLAQWGEDGRRIERFRESAEVALYTPGSSAGRPLTVLRSFAAPPSAIRTDADALRERIGATVSGLLALLGLDVDPVQSREHILLSTLLQQAWAAGQDLDLATLIGQVQDPPVVRVGVMDVETFFPSRDRSALAMRINSVLASPGFQAWLEGEPLDIGRLLWTPQGKPRIAVLSIAHLSDPERMFFVTILLNELIAWMRQQPGTPSLRALFYMDEIFGYFPPTAVPPSKMPMLTLLKQARAFGLGIVLATQNPVDLDYKGLANTGTWFLGRLQTERDKMRVLEGLEGAAASTGGSFDRAQMERTLAGLQSRVFLMNNVHEDAPVLFQTRWTLSYLRGPLTRTQIQQLTEGAAAPPAPEAQPAAAAWTAPVAPAGGWSASPPAWGAGQGSSPGSSPGPAPSSSPRAQPIVPVDADVHYLAVRRATPGARIVYQPALLGEADLRFAKGADIDQWETRSSLAPLSGDPGPRVWEGATPATNLDVRDQPEPGVAFAELPPAAMNAGSYKTWQRSFETFLYQSAVLSLYSVPAFRLVGKPGETEADLRVRARELAREGRDRSVEQLRRRYAPRLQTLQDRLQRAQDKIGREQAQVQQQQVQTGISVAATVLGALLGRKSVSVGTVGRATTAARGAGRVAREQGDVARAQEDVRRLQEDLAEMEGQFQQEAARITGGVDPETAEITEQVIRPRKGDTSVRRVSLVWVPVGVDSLGAVTPAWGP
jgi:hypothetical protein